MSEGEFVYLRRIQDLCLQNRKSLEVSYMHLANSPTLAIWVADCPAVVLNNFNLSARTVAEELFQTNRSVVPEHIFVRIDDLPIVDVITDVLSNQNPNQINEDPYTDQLVHIRGKVKSSTLVSSHVQKVIIEEVKKNWFTEGSLIEVVMRNDLVGQAPLGDIIEITGIVQPNKY